MHCLTKKNMIMSKGNMFQGMARGKVGDVVFYRMNGVQMARVRNRAPKNPRSNEQLYQRAVIATVMKAYSAGKEIYDHSFQGYTVGEGCMRRFNSVNARILRDNLIYDVNENVPISDNRGRFVYPKSLVSVPIPGIQVSEGSLKNTLFGHMVDNMYEESFPKYNDVPDQGMNGQQWLDHFNTAPGDVYTFVFHVGNTKNGAEYSLPGYSDAYSKVYDSAFHWVRFIVKESVLDHTESGFSLTAKYSDIFVIQTSSDNIQFNGEAIMSATASEIPFSVRGGINFGTYAIIRSRLDVDLRSTAYMHIMTKPFGLASAYVLPAWIAMIQKVGESDLILEGGPSEMVPRSIDVDDAPYDVQTEEELDALNYPSRAGSRKTARHKGSMPNTEG